MNENKTSQFIGLLRVVMGFIFLWAFLDKTWGLGFATPAERAWLAGGSPTAGFLQNAVHGPFADIFHAMAGSGLVDWLFMLGLLFVGVSLFFGIFVKLGSTVGFLMLLLMYTAVGLPPENNPILDDHIVYMLIMLIFMVSNAGEHFGLGRHWSRTNLVQKNKILK